MHWSLQTKLGDRHKLLVSGNNVTSANYGMSELSHHSLLNSLLMQVGDEKKIQKPSSA